MVSANLTSRHLRKMNRQQFIGFFFVVLFVGAHAARVESSIAVRRAEEKVNRPKDLDYKECAGFSCSTEGCERNYIWLDTPRQTCRYKETYKLSHRQDEFARVELDRLVSKTEKFKKTGCLFGTGVSYDTYAFKCVRRSTQMLRLLKFLSKVRKAAEADEAHPAHDFVKSDEFKNKMRVAGDNFVTGFEKYQQSDALSEDKQNNNHTAMDFRGAFTALMATADQDEASAEGVSEMEKDAQQAAQVTASMLKVLRVELDEDQKGNLKQTAEDMLAGDDDKDDAQDDAEAIMDLLAGDIETGMLGGAVDDTVLSTLPADQQELATKAVKESTSEGSAAAASLLQESSNSSVATRGTGPLKWIFKHGLGWVVARVFWLGLFAVGTALGLIRAALFPVFFLGCTLLKSLKWLTVDVVYWGGIEGETDPIVRGLQSIGRCPAEMWEALYFDSNAKHVVGQIFIQPAQFASWATGVEHPIWTERQLCKKIRCGENQYCSAGKCVCTLGHYATPDGSSCALATTKHGCKCKERWVKGVLWSTTYFGCPAASGRCLVDQLDPSFHKCKGSVKADTNWVKQGLAWASGSNSRAAIYDGCEAQPMHQIIPSLPEIVEEVSELAGKL